MLDAKDEQLEIELTEDELIKLHSLCDEADLSGAKDVFDYAMSILYWAVDEARVGRDLASVSLVQDEFQTFKLPLLEKIKASAA